MGNKDVYTATPVAGGWAVAVLSWAGAVMIWAGALTFMKYSYLNFSTFKQLKNAKKAKGDIQKAKGDRLTDQPTQEEERAKKNEMPKGSMWSSVPLPQFH